MMVGTEQQPRETGEAFYSPACIDRLLNRWAEVIAFAEASGGAISASRMRELISAAGAPPSDLYFYVHVKADIERAWVHLGGRWSEPFILIEHRMQGWPLAVIAREQRRRYEEVSRAYWRAVDTMARYLGWTGS